MDRRSALACQLCQRNAPLAMLTAATLRKNWALLAFGWLMTFGSQSRADNSGLHGPRLDREQGWGPRVLLLARRAVGPDVRHPWSGVGRGLWGPPYWHHPGICDVDHGLRIRTCACHRGSPDRMGWTITSIALLLAGYSLFASGLAFVGVRFVLGKAEDASG